MADTEDQRRNRAANRKAEWERHAERVDELLGRWRAGTWQPRDADRQAAARVIAVNMSFDNVGPDRPVDVQRIDRLVAIANTVGDLTTLDGGLALHSTEFGNCLTMWGLFLSDQGYAIPRQDDQEIGVWLPMVRQNLDHVTGVVGLYGELCAAIEAGHLEW